MFHFIEKYQEIVVNSLDLLSFLLVTPELIGITQSTAFFVFWVIVPMIFVFPFLMIMVGVEMLIVDTLVHMGWKQKTAGLISAIWVLFCMLVLIYLYLGISSITETKENTFFDRIIDRSTTRKTLFRAGVVLFLISRIIAFTGAVIKLPA